MLVWCLNLSMRGRIIICNEWAPIEIYLRFWHKLNYFLFCRNFEFFFFFSICAEILILIIKSKFEALWLLIFFFYLCWNFNNYYKIKIWSTSIIGFKLQMYRLLEVKDGSVYTQLDCITKTTKSFFIILYKYYLTKNSKLKKPTAKIKIWNLINYLAVCCQICLGTMVLR